MEIIIIYINYFRFKYYKNKNWKKMEENEAIIAFRDNGPDIVFLLNKKKL
jgi:hypothetical protein